jgi:hypothetical protein
MQWAERLLEGGGSEQWGDKWEERFKQGAGSKQARHPARSMHALSGCCTHRLARFHLAPLSLHLFTLQLT